MALPKKYRLGPTIEATEAIEVLTVLRIDEKPLLETHQAIGLSLLSLAILIVGGFVQVRSLVQFSFFPTGCTKCIYNKTIMVVICSKNLF